MTDDEIRIAVADASGLQARYGLRKRGLWYRPDAKGYTGMSAQAGRYTLEEAKKHECVHGQDDDVTIAALPLPDYPNDLNAMHEAAMTLKLHSRTEYCVELRKIIMRDATVEQQDPDTGRVTDHAFYQATARQRAEAYLRTIGKWK